MNFFPEELHATIISTGKKKKRASINLHELDLSKLAELEKEEVRLHSAVSKEEQNDSDEPEELEDEFDDEDGENDYGVDYYDEDQDAFGDDGGDD
jgi:hypothetical protein